ncbi:AAA family ATPase [Telmatocola sphagniphila]|uniref:AAA family ATPase n=1 Tax=Telmatocola sphagniphila TaxID=1123043 RepID=A0A8E6B5L5_9BACT|nr:AAA family ATPase [Telmatocola sphagniphila]QVL32322.1 AAA family ATPase [Telmatocola sphagniphila]
MIENQECFDPQALLAALAEAGAEIHSPSKIRCPFHDDTNPSASIYEEGGHWRFKCFAANCGFLGDVLDVRRQQAGGGNRLGSAFNRQTLLKPGAPMGYDTPRPPKPYLTLEALVQSEPNCKEHYRYTDPETGTVDMLVLRIEPPGEKKRFVQCHFSAEYAGWIKKHPPLPFPIYNRKRVLTAKVVIVVEGEKCVHALQSIGMVATTCPGGARRSFKTNKGTAEEADWRPLAGKIVFLWPDNDVVDPKTGKRGGVEHMRAVAAELAQLEPPCKLMWIDPDAIANNPPKGDAADFVARFAGQNRSEEDLRDQVVLEVLDKAVPLGGPAQSLEQLIEDTIAGKRTSIEWPWRQFTILTQALLPGTVTIFCGEPGSGKSFMLLQAMFHLFENGVPLAMYMLEDGIDIHLLRVLAQLSNKSDITNASWVKDNGPFIQSCLSIHKTVLDQFSRCLTAEGESNDIPTYAMLLNWIEKKMQAGARVVVVDPITAASPAEKPWVEDKNFLLAVKRLAVRFGSSIILTTHPKKQGRSNNHLDDLAGGAGFARFTHTIVWLKRLDKPETSTVYPGWGGSISVKHNRILHIVKTRNAQGAGVDLAFSFSTESLKFKEEGIIEKD